MQVFVNECSLHEQIFDRSDFKNAIRTFLSVFMLFQSQNTEKQIFQRGDLFLNYKAIRDELFIKSMSHIADKSLATAVKNTLFNKLNARDWQEEQLHSSDDLFECNEDIVTDTSMAELAERKLQNTDLLGMLVNFPASKFATTPSAEVIKNEKDSIDLDCVEDRTSLEEWLEKNFRLSTFRYDYTSTSPPTDEQTVLRDKSRFEHTSLQVQGRRVYRERKTGRYWYVDNLHDRNKAQLEVFDSRGRHIGEADLEGQIDYGKKDNTKRIDIK